MDVDNLDGSARASGNSPGFGGGLASTECIRKSASTTRMETIRFHHRWAIEQFSVQLELAPVGESIQSSNFGDDDRYKFQLKLHPSGKDEECRGFLSLFLQIHKCPSPKLRFRVNFYIDTTEGAKGCALNRNVVTINKGGIVTASKFFATDVLKGRAQKYMPDDTLTVGVELTVFGDNQCSVVPIEEVLDSEPVEPNREPVEGSLGMHLATLIGSEEYADCVLRVGDREFRAHKAILSARSPVFAAMFGHPENQEAQASEATLEDVTADSVSALLEFIYKDSCCQIEDRPDEILAAADKYCLERLKILCEMKLAAGLKAENVCEALKLADSFSAHHLRQHVESYIRKNKQDVLTSSDWMELEREFPSLAAGTLKTLLTPTLPDVDRVSLGEPASKRPRVR